MSWFVTCDAIGSPIFTLPRVSRCKLELSELQFRSQVRTVRNCPVNIPLWIAAIVAELSIVCQFFIFTLATPSLQLGNWPRGFGSSPNWWLSAWLPKKMTGN